MSLFYVIKVCFHFAHLIYPKMNHGGPLFFSLICTVRFLVIVMVEHKGRTYIEGVHKLNPESWPTVYLL